MLALVLPIAFQNLISALDNMEDLVILGGVGQSTLSAVSPAEKVNLVLILFYFGISIGAGILTAAWSSYRQRLGCRWGQHHQQEHSEMAIAGGNPCKVIRAIPDRDCRVED